MLRKYWVLNKNKMHEDSSSADYAWQRKEPTKLELVNCSLHVTKVVDNIFVSHSVTSFVCRHGLNKRVLRELTILAALTHLNEVLAKFVQKGLRTETKTNETDAENLARNNECNHSFRPKTKKKHLNLVFKVDKGFQISANFCKFLLLKIVLPPRQVI